MTTSSSQSSQKECSQDFRVIKKLSSSNAKVYLIYSHSKKEFMAMKLFDYQKDKPAITYENEARFCGIAHPNIISYHSSHDRQKCSKGGALSYCSMITMELAPYGTLFEACQSTEMFKDMTLVRTYFHEIISGLEYLHSHNMYHLDLKPENILIGSDFNLKIADFDSAYMRADSFILSRGTKNYRAPELRKRCPTEYKKADIYSAGIILFLLATGFLPYIEDKPINGYDLEELLWEQDSSLFWDAQKRIHKNFPQLDNDLKNLLIQMLKFDTTERASLEDIKLSPWYQGKNYSEAQLIEKVSPQLTLMTL